MKKLILIMLIGFTTVSLFGQSNFKKGIFIGNKSSGSNIILLDSAIYSNRTLKFFNSGSLISVNPQITADITIKEQGDSVLLIPSPFSSYIAYADTNLTTVLQNALDQLTSGGVIYIKKGLYDNLDSVIVKYDYTTIVGDGMYRTILKQRPAYDTPVNEVKAMLYVNGKDYLTIKDIQFDGNSANQTHAWEPTNTNALLTGILDAVPGSEFLLLDKIYLHDFTHFGVWFEEAYNSIIRNSRISDNNENNITLSSYTHNNLIENNITGGSNSVSIAMYGHDNIAKNNIVGDPGISGGWGIEIAGKTGFTWALRNKVINNDIYGSYGNGIGMGTYSRYCVIQNNRIHDIGFGSTGTGIYVTNDTATSIIGNVIYQVINYGIVVNGGVRTKIVGNIVDNGDSLTGTAGLKLGTGNDAVLSQDCYIADNYFYVKLYAIQYTRGGADNVFMNNYLRGYNGYEFLSNTDPSGTVTSNNYQYTTSKYVMNQGVNSPSTNTVRLVVGIPGATGTDFDWTSAANTTAQNLDLGAIIPANSKVTDIEIKCTTTLASSAGAVDITYAVGNVSAGDQFILASSCNASNEIVGIIDASKPVAVVMSANSSHIWLQGVPDQNWDTMTDGEWVIWVTYESYY